MAQILILQTKIDCCRLKLAIQRATSAVTVLPIIPTIHQATPKPRPTGDREDTGLPAS
jgi:hypothetical protein